MKFNKTGNFCIGEEEIIEVFSYALKRLVIEDGNLLKSGAHEHSLQFRLASYLREVFSIAEYGGLRIDIEYNREGENDIKRRSSGSPFYQDIILHERGSSKYNGNKKHKNNIFSCEIKINSENNNDDAERIREQMENRRYQYGINLFKLTDKRISLSLYTHHDRNIDEKSYSFDFEKQRLEIKANG